MRNGVNKTQDLKTIKMKNKKTKSIKNLKRLNKSEATNCEVKPKRFSSKSLMKQEQIRQEVYAILHKEAHNWFGMIRGIEDNSNKRLNAMEQSAMPYNALEEIKDEMRKMTYSISKNTKAIENLLNFFNVSKQFLNDENKIKSE